MSDNYYRLWSRWTADGTAAEVGAIFRDTESIVQWCPSAFLKVEILVPATPECETGKVARVRAKGWMPHTLSFTSRVIDSWYPFGYVMEVEGDFEGRLYCSSQASGDRLAIDNDWRVRVAKPFVRRFSRLLRPVFVSNHRWVVARTQEGLDLELRRRRAAARGGILAEQPMRPTFPHGPLATYFSRPAWTFATLLDSSEREGTEADGDPRAPHHQCG